MPAARPWKGVIYNCCGVYGRIYQNLNTLKWTGNCPKCFKAIIMINPELGK